MLNFEFNGLIFIFAATSATGSRALGQSPAFAFRAIGDGACLDHSQPHPGGRRAFEKGAQPAGHHHRDQRFRSH